MKKNLVHLIAGVILFAYALPTATAPEQAPSFSTMTLAPGDSYELPPVTLSTTTPVPDKVTGYVIIPLNYQWNKLVSIEQTNADQAANRTLIGGSRQAIYTVKLAKNLPEGAYFYIVPTTLEAPTGDPRKTVAKIIVAFPTVTLKPGASYDLPPVIRSATTPMPDKVTGYTVVPADFGPQKKDFVHIEKTTTPTSTDPNRMGASEQDRYTLRISPAIPTGSHFSIISTTQAHPKGDIESTLVKVTIE